MRMEEIMEHTMEYTDYSNRVPVRFLYDGTPIPAIGIGTFGSDKYKPEQIAEAVYGAVKTGYRLIDCASVYGNEQDIGNTLQRLFDEGYIARKDLFITSKVWNDQHREVEKSCRRSLSDLRLDYLDLYFVHWPFPNYHAPGCSGDSRNADILSTGRSRIIMRRDAAATQEMLTPGLSPSMSSWIPGDSANRLWTRGWCAISR